MDNELTDGGCYVVRNGRIFLIDDLLAMTDNPPPKQSEPDPNGWDRFERAVDAALHTQPKHKPKVKPESSPKEKDNK